MNKNPIKKQADKIKRESISQEDLALINAYTRKELSADEVYTFSVVLCDNDIDRDLEYFTSDTLEELSKMFVGVTGIYDHNPSAKNQVARIYSCKTENLSPKKTAYGADYVRLTAKAYLPVCESNKDLIAMLDSGIKKEISVGCGIEECVCSICGEDMRINTCGHIKGRYYDGKMCCGILKSPTDAYEWSFTAVPAQKNAGVIKSIFKTNESSLAEEFLSKSYGESVSLSVEEAESLKSYINGLKNQAAESNRYKSLLELETVKSGITAKIGIESDLLEKMVKCLKIDELLQLKETFEKRSSEIFPIRPQVFGEQINADFSNYNNTAFHI